MNFKTLGATDISVSEIGMGLSKYKGGAETILAAVDCGVNLFDTAERYGSEEVLGEAVRKIRHEVRIATKFSPYNSRQELILKSIDRSLSKLKTDYVDLYQLHALNPEVPLEETLGVMEDLVDAGKIRSIGVCNLNLCQLEVAVRMMRKHKISSLQISYNLIDRRGVAQCAEYCRRHNISIIAYSPLGRNPALITQRDRSGVLNDISRETGKTVAQVALNWTIADPSVISIPKSNRVERVRENCTASGWHLTPAQRRRLEDGVRPLPRVDIEKILKQVYRKFLIRIGRAPDPKLARKPDFH